MHPARTRPGLSLSLYILSVLPNNVGINISQAKSRESMPGFVLAPEVFDGIGAIGVQDVVAAAEALLSARDEVGVAVAIT